MKLIRYWLILAAGTALAAYIVPGITYDTTGTLILVVLVLSLLNAIFKPLLILFTLPFIILTLGLGIWVINALLLYFTSHLITPFHVAGFGSALLGSLVISLTHFIAGRLFKDGDGNKPRPKKHHRNSDTVIDV